MSAATEIRKSPLHDLHVLSGARLIDFHGWLLPVQYSSVIEEHLATRQAAGLFDISHMGQVIVSGPKAFDFLQHLMTGDVRRTIEKSLGVYGHLCQPNGGVLDDIFVYGLKQSNEFLVIVNSSTHEKDVAWMREHATEGVQVQDLQGRAALAIQGPKALEVVRRTVAGIAELPRFAYQRISNPSPDESFWACRTGYTGEEGAEFFGPIKTISTLWKQLVESGQPLGLKPCGLGARDTLRLEVGYPLYGNELLENRTSLEANMEWAVKWAKGDFIGRAAIEKQRAAGLQEILLAYQLKERGVPRSGCKVFGPTAGTGETTSGTFSPSMQKGIGLAYAPVAWNKPGTAIDVGIHNKRVPAEVVTLPFLKKP